VILHHLSLLGHGVPGAPGGRHRACHQRRKGCQKMLEQDISTGNRDEAVKLDFEPGHAVTVIVTISHPMGEIEQPFSLDLRPETGCKRASLDLDAAAGFPYLLHSDLACLRRMCERHDKWERCRRRHARLSPVSNVYDTQCGERSDRFANYGAADLHRINQRSFTRELIADPKLLVTNKGSDLMHCLLDQAAGFGELHIHKLTCRPQR
jgi:hypothetical protein